MNSVFHATKPISLFPGEAVPYPPRPAFVIGVDRPRGSDGPFLAWFERELQLCCALSSLPGTPFTGRFRVMQAD